MSRRGMKYNPGFLSDEELVRSFCVRRAEFGLITETLRESTGNSNPHLIVIGPRGMGKTTLLLRIAIEIRRDPALGAGWFPIVFAEESYEISTCGEFWLQCLSHLAEQAPIKDGEPNLRRTHEELRKVRDERTLADRCLATILDFSDRAGKRLVLIVENLNRMFDDIRNDEVGWELRHTLQNEPRIFLLGSATSRFEEIDNSSKALYDLFQVFPLERLDAKACAVLWKGESGQDIEPGKSRSLQILTGGNPRLLSIVARFGAQLSFHKLMEDLLDLVDDHSEYFRSYLEALAPQERRVFLALATLWEPSSARRVADFARLPTSQCSALLGRLAERGAVLRSGGTPRRVEYSLAERMYNIYYLLRKGRGANRLVEALVRFMTSFYSRPEWSGLQDKISDEAVAADESMRGLLDMVRDQLSRATSVEALKASLSRSSPQPTRGVATEELAREFAARARELCSNWQFEEAVRVCEEFTARFGDTRSLVVVREIADALTTKAKALARLGRPEEGLAACNEVVIRLSDRDSADVAEMLATANANKVGLLCSSGRWNDALQACESFPSRFGTSDHPLAADVQAAMLYNKGVALARLGQAGAARAAFDEVARCVESSHELIARSLVAKGELLDTAGRPRDASAYYDSVVNRFGGRDDLNIEEVVADAMLRKGSSLRDQDRLEEALTTYEEVARRFGQGDPPRYRSKVAMARLNAGSVLGLMGRLEEERAAYDEVVGCFVAPDSPETAAEVAAALVNKAISFVRSNKVTEALSIYDTVEDRFNGTESPIILYLLRSALLARAALHTLLRQFTAAIETTERALAKGDSVPPDQRLLCFLVRAEALFGSDNPTECEAELAKMLELVRECDAIPKQCLDALLVHAIRFGPERVLGLVENSRATTCLHPLVTALRQEAGINVSVAKEVAEVASDIRQELARMQRLGTP